MIDSVELDQPLLVALTKMQEQNLNFIAFVAKEKTHLNACMQNTDLLQFLTSHWSEDTSIF